MTTLLFNTPVSAVAHFDDEGNLLVIETRSTLLEILDVGIPGPPGAAASQYVFICSSPLATWVVNHNLGYTPSSVRVLSVGGIEVDAEVTNISDNQLTINFVIPFVGRAIIG